MKNFWRKNSPSHVPDPNFPFKKVNLNHEAKFQKSLSLNSNIYQERVNIVRKQSDYHVVYTVKPVFENRITEVNQNSQK